MIEQFNAEMPHAEAQLPSDVLSQTLGLGVKYCVAAIGVVALALPVIWAG
jgi:hypothetical protein